MAPKAKLRDTWRLVRPYARPRFKYLALAAALGWVGALCQVASIALIEPLWNRVIFPSAAPEATNDVAGEGRVLDAVFDALEVIGRDLGSTDDPRLASLLVITALLVILGIVAGLANYGFLMLSRWVALGMVVELRQDIARHLVGLSLRYHGQRSFGDLLSRISADVQTTLGAIDTALKRLIQEPAFIVIAFVTALYHSWLLTLVAVIGVPLIALPISFLSKRIRKGSQKSLTTLGASVQALAQMFQGIRTVKAFRGEERELERYRQLNEQYVRKTLRMVSNVAIARSWTTFVTQVGIAVLLLGAGLATIQLDLFDDPGSLVAFFMLLSVAFSHLKHFVQAVTKVDESIGASNRLQAILDETVDVREAATPVPMQGIGAGLRLEGVSFSYPDGDKPALEGVDLDVRPGETLGLVGASGSGKSTLVDLVCRFFDPTEGRLTVDGTDLRDVSMDDWTGLFAMVGQHPFLFHATVEENIGYGRPDATREEIEAAARAANIHEFIESLPEGYETDVADAGDRLSGGQRQRITIARAILKDAPLLLLDEATSALDSESEAAVQEALDRLRQDRTVIVIAHRLSTIQNADRIAVLDAGRVVEVGTHEELVALGGAYARLYSLQRLDAPAAT